MALSFLERVLEKLALRKSPPSTFGFRTIWRHRGPGFQGSEADLCFLNSFVVSGPFPSVIRVLISKLNE